MKKKKTILAALVLLLVVAVGGAIAYFTDTDTKTNTFTIGNVDISLTEDGWDALADANNNDIPDVAEDMMPGESVTKDPTINNLSTKNPAYVFAKVEVPCTTIVAPATTSEERIAVRRSSVSPALPEMFIILQALPGIRRIRGCSGV